MTTIRMVIMAIILVVTTISTSSTAIAKQSNTNPPFEIKLKDEIVQPITQFNVIPAQVNVENGVTAYSASGKLIHLNPKKQPILFEAYWCPHCQRTIVMMDKERSQLNRLPILVSLGFQPNTSLKQAVQLTNKEITELHLKNLKVYYLLQYHVRNFVPNGIPELLFPYHHRLETLSGEHTFQIWKTAINQR